MSWRYTDSVQRHRHSSKCSRKIMPHDSKSLYCSGGKAIPEWALLDESIDGSPFSSKNRSRQAGIASSPIALAATKSSQTAAVPLVPVQQQTAKHFLHNVDESLPPESRSNIGKRRYANGNEGVKPIRPYQPFPSESDYYHGFRPHPTIRSSPIDRKGFARDLVYRNTASYSSEASVHGTVFSARYSRETLSVTALQDTMHFARGVIPSGVAVDARGFSQSLRGQSVPLFQTMRQSKRAREKWVDAPGAHDYPGRAEGVVGIKLHFQKGGKLRMDSSRTHGKSQYVLYKCKCGFRVRLHRKSDNRWRPQLRKGYPVHHHTGGKELDIPFYIRKAVSDILNGVDKLETTTPRSIFELLKSKYVEEKFLQGDLAERTLTVITNAMSNYRKRKAS